MYKRSLILIQCATCKYLVKLQRGLKPVTISIEKLKYYIDDHAFSRMWAEYCTLKKRLGVASFFIMGG